MSQEPLGRKLRSQIMSILEQEILRSIFEEALRPANVRPKPHALTT